VPRKKKKPKVIEKTCPVCEGNFQCTRDDKETCGPTCRKRLSRANGEARAARNGAMGRAGQVGFYATSAARSSTSSRR